MKHKLLSMFALLLCVSAGHAAVPACPAACDSHWKACTSSCGSGQKAFTCKTSCAGQHEDCLNGCNKTSASGNSYGAQQQGEIPPTSGARETRRLPPVQADD